MPNEREKKESYIIYEKFEFRKYYLSMLNYSS